MTDHEQTPTPAAPVSELQRTISLMLEHNRKGYDIQSLLFHAQKLAGALADSPAVSVIAGYKLKARPNVFYPADWKPTDSDNFVTLVYARGDHEEPAEPHYVLRYDDKVGGPPGKNHALVSVANWNAGMSRAVADQVCDDQGQPLVVYPRPIIGPPTSAGADGQSEPA